MRTFSILLVFCMITALAPCSAVATDGAGPYWESVGHLHPDDYTFLNNRPQSRSARSVPVVFKYLYVDSSGASSKTKGAVGTKIEVAGSPKTSQRGLEVAGSIVAKMTRNMPKSVFKSLATTGSVGVFTASEKLTVYPEYADLASGECGDSCSGDCKTTCTFDGRKYEDLAGAAGSRATIVEDNLLCTDDDPYGKKQSILAHEFAHVIHSEGLSSALKQQLTKAYNNAKAKKLWKLTSYAMSNEDEYFAEAATAFVYISQNNDAAGGMVFCGKKLCTSEKANRAHLKSTDPDLYKILSFVFTNDRPDLEAGLTVCPAKASG